MKRDTKHPLYSTIAGFKVYIFDICYFIHCLLKWIARRNIMPKLLLASTNAGKLREIRDLLQDMDFDICSPSELNIKLDVKEDGHTYAENAASKALAFAQHAGLLSLADDSGLEVEALAGAPGLYSARYSPKHGADDADRRSYLLSQLQGHPRPWGAKFHCTVSISTPEGDLYFTEGDCPGEIIPQERGFGGFGYDPIFLIPQKGLTMAELSMAEKNLLSHRSKAVKNAIPLLMELLSNLD
jgi:XTP/dITP diphosphohydrolase